VLARHFPVFPPARIPRQPYRFSGPVYGESPLPVHSFVPLTDRGVYDNMGLEALIKTVGIPGLDEPLDPAEFLVVSDGGAPPNLHLRNSGLPAIGEALLLYRVDEISREQVTALRTRAIVRELIAKKRQGLFVSLRSDVNKVGADAYKKYCARVNPQGLVPGPLVEMIRAIRTSLDRFDPVESSALMYQAYMMTDAFLMVL
jgi:NTE family protein